MASKLWAYGKRLTIWGALVSALPLLFFPLLFFSVLGIAISVPLGCSVAIYVCFRKFYCTLFKEEVEVPKGLGVKEIEARGISDVQESEEDKSRIQERTIHEDNVKPLGEETEKVKGLGGEAQAELDPCGISSDEEEQPHEGLILSRALKCEGEAPLIEKLVPHEEAPEEEQSQVREKSVLHEEAPEDEAQKGDAREAQHKEMGDPDEEVESLQWEAQKEQLDPFEEQGHEVEDQKDEVGEVPLKENGDTHEDEEEALHTLQLEAQKEQLNPIEEQAPELETHKDEVGEAQLKENGDTHEEQAALHTLQLESQKDQLNPIEEQAALHTLQLESQKDQLNPIEEQAALHTLQLESQKDQLNPIEEQAPEFETQKDEAQLKANGYTHEEEEPIQGERGAEEVKDEDEVSKGGAQLNWDSQEEENARQDQAAEVEIQSSPKKEVEVELKVNPSEGEPQSDHNNGGAGENIGTKHKRVDEQDESNGKLYSTDSKHKTREEEDKEHDESNEVQGISHKRSRHEQSLDLAPSTLHTENVSTETNVVTPETTPYSGQQSIKAEGPLGTSNLGVENDERIEDYVDAELPIPLSSEMLVTSASESDKDSKSLSEGAVKEDTEDAEHLWEEIHALRNIIGYKEEPQLLYAEEIKALYVFTGVEPPVSLKYSGDLDRAKEKLVLLKRVYGIK